MAVEKYTSKPANVKEFDAVQYVKEMDVFGIILKHQCDYRMCPLCGGDNQIHDYIETPKGSVIVKPGDYIAKEANGEFKVYGESVFNIFFRKVSDVPKSYTKEDVRDLFGKFYEQVKHGDEEHQKWLFEETLKFLEAYVS